MPLLETKGAGSAQGFGLSLGGEEAVYIEDVFSTYLYTGNGSTQTITNGIDLAGEGGLTWIKGRSGATDHQLFDTVRGATKELISNSTAAEATDADTLTAFNSDGFSLGADSNTNTNAATYASWTFRKQPKFFDVVTYTGNGVNNRQIAYQLSSAVKLGAVIVKRTDAASYWPGMIGSAWSTGQNPTSFNIFLLNTTTFSSVNGFVSAFGTDGTFRLTAGSTDISAVNANGGTYIAYIFAHDTSEDSLIQCGMYKGNGSSTGPTVTLGWEPQWLLIRNVSAAADVNIIDNMRGFTVGGTDAELNPNLTNAESTGTFVTPTSTGFQINTTAAGYNTNASYYIYIAIRRGPMKVPTSGAEVFVPDYVSSGSIPVTTTTGFPVDLAMSRSTGVNFTFVSDRLRGATRRLVTSSTDAEAAFGSGNEWSFDLNTTVIQRNTVPPVREWLFRRAPGFFDVVCYTGTGVARTVAHNLGAVPELMIVKKRNDAGLWIAYHVGIDATSPQNYGINLGSSAAAFVISTLWDNTAPTASVFTVGTYSNANSIADTFVAYLFATVAGVSKVGSYTGTGTTQTINCGFTAGARFVLIKRTDSTGDWYVWDSARGIVAGNDPYLLLNSTAAEVTSTDYIDTASTGFEISSTAPAEINANGGNFIFLAIA